MRLYDKTHSSQGNPKNKQPSLRFIIICENISDMTWRHCAWTSWSLPPKRLQPIIKRHSVTSQKTWILRYLPVQ